MTAAKTIGLLGCGLWGRNILRNLKQLGATVIVIEPNEAARQQATAGGAAAVLQDATGLPQVDGIVVATPASSHAAVIEQVARLNVPIFTEKPFTTDVASARSLVERFRERLFVMHVWRYHAGVEMLRDLARSQELGPVSWLRTTRTNWTSPRLDVDPLWTLAPHDLSIALEILGEVPKPKYAVAEMSETGPCSLMAILGETPTVVLEVSTRHAEKRREVRLHCRDGVAVLKDGEVDYLEILRPGADDPLAVEIERRHFVAEPPLLRELQTFLEYLAGGPPPRSSAAEGLAAVSAMVQIRALAGL